VADLLIFLSLVFVGFGAVVVATLPPIQRRLVQSETRTARSREVHLSDERQIIEATIQEAERLGRGQDSSDELRMVQAAVQEADKLGLGQDRPDLVLGLMGRLREDLRLHRQQAADLEGLVAVLMARVDEVRAEQRAQADTEHA
jgi:hypothetical protein